MAAQATDTTAIKLGGVTQILMTPYESGVKGSTTYSLDNIVADSTSITQEELETNTVDCETRTDPIFENITLGSYTFEAQSGDVQSIILEKCFGFTKDTNNGNLYAPTSYKELWAEIEVVFGDKGSLVCPKVKLGGNIEASTLKTGMVYANISGTCYSVEITKGDNSTKIMTPFYYKAPAEE